MDCGLVAALIVFVILLIVHVGRARSNYERKYIKKTLMGLDLAEADAQEREMERRTGMAFPDAETEPIYSDVEGAQGPQTPRGLQLTQRGVPIATMFFNPTPGAPPNQTYKFTDTSGNPITTVQVTRAPAPPSNIPMYPEPPATSRTVSEAPSNQIAAPVPVPSAPLVTDTNKAKKKGFVAGVSDPTCAAKIAVLNCDWYYTWGSKPPAVGPPGLLFTPMYWSVNNAPSGALASFSADNVPQGWDAVNLLTYNEPDGTNAGAQANMTVGEAVAKWPDIAATGRRLGSPVMFGSLVHPGTSVNNTPLPSSGTNAHMVNISNDPNAPNLVTLDPTIWLDNFLIQINLLPTRPRNPDFICVHWYGPPQADSFLNYLTAVNTKYRLPIWVTEYSCADWPATCCGGNPPGTQHTAISGISWDAFAGTPLDAAQNSTANFMQQTVQGMENMEFVEKYSWKERFKLVPFANPTGIQGDSPEGPSNPDHMNQSALFDSYVHFPTALPQLTPLGILYASF